MHKLISELQRLYLFDGQRYLAADGGEQALTPAALAQHLSGEQTLAVKLVSDAGLVRAIVMEFGGKGSGEQHWADLCTIANALQHELDLPAPAVSISGMAFQLWLSLATPVPLVQSRQFVQLLRSTFLPASTDVIAVAPPAYVELAQLPPCLQPSGKWAAFIHPGMGAAFADEPGLDMQPTPAAQLGFLDGVRSITPAQFAQALAKLQQHAAGLVPEPLVIAAAPVATPAAPAGLLLQDATLEDIVRWLHARNIEPTFRHRLP